MFVVTANKQEKSLTIGRRSKNQLSYKEEANIKIKKDRNHYES